MGVKIFRDDNWDRIEMGIVTRRDILGLDPVEDRHLLDYLILHSREVLKDMAMRKYHIEEMPEPRVNVDDPPDEIYRTYFVLREQVEREDDIEVLKAAAFRTYRTSLSTFAFCRLTGYSWPPSECDAYSYRTYECDKCPDMTKEDIESFCVEMIRNNGQYRHEAEEILLSSLMVLK